MANLKCVSLWSGGKDSCFACYKAKLNNYDIRYILNFTYIDPQGASAHNLNPAIIADQAQSIGIQLIQRTTTRENYENNFKEVVNGLKKEDIEAIVFGDIYLQEHKDWIEEVCRRLNIIPVFPLWGLDTNDILNEFIDLGFKAIIVSIRKDILGKEWLGRNLDADFLKDLKKNNNEIDPCGEKGEFHTLVTSGPNFKNRIDIVESRVMPKLNHWNLDILKWKII